MTTADLLTSADLPVVPTDPLLEPFQLKHLTLSSRIISASHATAYAQDALPKERYLRYHLEKAKGGVAMTMMGGASCVAPESPAFVNNIALYKDEIVPHLRRLSDAVHEYDTLIMCQVTHAGRRTSNYAADWLPIISSSRVREDQHRSFPKVAEDWDIERTIEAFATGVERCQEGGLDGVELMGVGQLLDQFWSPALNHRDDEWGGDFERRLRFPIEVLRAIRKRVGNNFVIGARIAIDELLPNGLQMEEGVALVNRLTEEGLDFLSLIRGGYDSDARLGGVIPPMGTKEAPHLDFAGEVKRQISIPVMHAGRIRNFDMARDALTAGKVDLIGMVRPLISDPYLVKHLREGTPERIRPTLGSGFGIDRIYQGGDMLDIGNPAVGRETTLPHIVPKAPQQKRAVVVGAGVAGLEAARTLAERGHDVTLVEAQDRAGGQVNLVTSIPRRQDFHRLIDWRISELDHLNVQVRYNTKATAEFIRNHAPDVVVVATGGTNYPQVPGADPGLLTDGWKVITGHTPVSGTVMIFDDHGDHPGLAVAEAILATGVELEFVTPERSVGVDLGATNYPPYLKLFAQHGVNTTLTTQVTGVRRVTGGQLEVELTEVFSGIKSHKVIDHLIVENGTIPADELYFELKPGSINGGAVDLDDLLAVRPQNTVRNSDGTYQLFRVGDAVCSRNIAAAILDSYRLCLAI